MSISGPPQRWALYFTIIFGREWSANVARTRYCFPIIDEVRSARDDRKSFVASLAVVPE
jgi:hypothetical protein